MTNVVDSVRQTVEQQPLSVALVDGNDELTYRDLWIRASEFAGGLREYDVRAGDAVPICLPNSTAFVVSLLGTLRKREHRCADQSPVRNRRESRDHTAGRRERRRRDGRSGDGYSRTSTRSTRWYGSATVRIWESTSRRLPTPTGSTTSGKSSSERTRIPHCSRIQVRKRRERRVWFSHEALRSNAEAVAEIVPGGLGPEDEQLSVLPATHLFNITPFSTRRSQVVGTT
ncbi:hypothetical protein D8S78_07825 [Natrialba swarupiae]|nr:hypothetical protein [Natrialba swarupiae]